MADDLSLLLRVRGDASGAQKAAADTRTAIAQLRSQVTSDSKALANVGQSVTSSLQGMGGPVGSLAGQIGNATSMLSGFSTEAAGVAGPIGIAVAAFVALHAAAFTLAKQFFDLTVATADWQGKLYDLSQQTGVSVETLSALDAVAQDTGGSIESVAQSLVIFQQHLEEAQDSGSKAGKQFRELGISTNETEEAFRDALKALAAMPVGFRQTNDAAELFGRRGGKQILAILKETNGDIDGTIKNLRDLNSLVTEDVARTSDRLNDQLKSNQRQFRGLQAQIVNDSMPAIIGALQDFSRVLRENRETIALLGRTISILVDAGFRLIKPAVDAANVVFQGHQKVIEGLVGVYQTLATAMQILWGSGIPKVDPNAIPAISNRSPGQDALDLSHLSILNQRGAPRGGGGGGGGGRAQISAAQQLLNELTREYNQLQDEANQRTRLQITLLDERFLKANAGERQQIEARAREIEALEKTIESNKRKADAAEMVRTVLERQLEAINDARKGDEQWEDEIVKLEAALKKLGLAMDDNTKKMIRENAETLKALNLTRERIALEQTRIDRMERDRLATPERKQEQLEREQGIIRSEGDETRERQIEPPDVSIWDQTLGAIEERMIGFHEASQMYVVGAFHNMADAAASAIEAWILYGGSLGKALKQALAAELAAISARAMVQAALHAAYAIGSLAMGNFTAAGQHAIAAAKFAAVAALTGFAARGLAGPSPQAASNSGAASRGGSSGGSSSQSNQAPGVTDVNRRALAEPQKQIIEVRFVGEWEDLVEAKWINRYSQGGRLRNFVKTDGQG